MRRHTHTIAYRDESRLFYMVLSLFVVVVGLYMYFVSSSVLKVVMLKEVDAQVADMGTRMSEIEEEYIEMQHSVSSDIATHKGFVVATEKIFIDKTADTLVMSTR